MEHIFDSTALTNTGKYVDATSGELSSNDNWNATDYIDIKNVRSMVIVGMQLTSDYTPTNTGYAFYDSDYKYISGVSYNYDASSGSTKTYAVDSIPSNARYVRACITVSATSKFSLKLSNTEFDFVTTKGGIKGADGTIDTTYDGYYTDEVDVHLAGKIAFVGLNFSSSATVELGYAFYDAEHNYVSGENYTKTASSTVNMDYEVDVPSTAYYFRSCIKRGNETSVAMWRTRRTSTQKKIIKYTNCNFKYTEPTW